MILSGCCLVLYLQFIIASTSYQSKFNKDESVRPIFNQIMSVPPPISPVDEELPKEMNSTSCGGVLLANGGFITYKFGQSYKNNERCIWTIRTPKWQTSFLMHNSSFHSMNDYLGIYVLDDNGNLQLRVKIDTSTGNKIVGAIGPTVFLVFTSDQIGIGEGFKLEYFGFGYNEITGYTYEHSHFDKSTGKVNWPAKPMEQFINSFVTFTLSPNLGVKVILTVNKVDLMSLANGCGHNVLNVFQLFHNGFIQRLKYCERDFSTSATISSTSPLLIIYTASLGPKQEGIEFSWKKESTGLLNDSILRVIM